MRGDSWLAVSGDVPPSNGRWAPRRAALPAPGAPAAAEDPARWSEVRLGRVLACGNARLHTDSGHAGLHTGALRPVLSALVSPGPPLAATRCAALCAYGPLKVRFTEVRLTQHSHRPPLPRSDVLCAVILHVASQVHC